MLKKSSDHLQDIERFKAPCASVKVYWKFNLYRRATFKNTIAFNFNTAFQITLNFK